MKNETVNWDNYEEYLLLQVDGELDEAGKQALLAFITANPEVQEELAMYEDVKLVPDATITFEGKDALLKREPKVIVLPSRKWLYAAAAVVAGIGIMLPLFWKTDVNTTRLATLTQQQVKMPVVAKQTPQVITTAPVAPVAVVQRSVKVAEQHVEGVKTVQQQVVVPHEEALAQLDANAASNQVNTAHATAFVGDQIQPIAQITVALVKEIKEQEEKKTIHFAAQNAAAFQNIKNAVATNIEKIEHTRKLFKDAALSLKMGNRNLTINF